MVSRGRILSNDVDGGTHIRGTVAQRQEGDAGKAQQRAKFHTEHFERWAEEIFGGGAELPEEEDEPCGREGERMSIHMLVERSKAVQKTKLNWRPWLELQVLEKRQCSSDPSSVSSKISLQDWSA